MIDSTKRTEVEIYVDIHALDMLYAMLAISDKRYSTERKTLQIELEGLSNDDKR